MNSEPDSALEARLRERIRELEEGFRELNARPDATALEKAVEDLELEAEMFEKERAAWAKQAFELGKRMGTLEKILRNAPHGALCKRGLQGLYDKEAPCTCWKRGVEIVLGEGPASSPSSSS